MPSPDSGGEQQRQCHHRKHAVRQPAARMQVVPSAGHFAHQERPEVVNELLLAALARTETPA